MSDFPSGIVLNNTVGVTVNVSDPDGLYNYSTIVLYSSGLGILSVKVNDSLNFRTEFTGLSNATSYYFQAFASDNNGDFIDSGLYPFEIRGSATCAQESGLLSIMKVLYVLIVLLFLAGGIYLFKSDGINVEGMVLFVVGTIILVVVMPLIFNLINHAIY
jgi:hypothetical protein